MYQQYQCKVTFNIKTMRHSYLLIDDNRKFTANVRDKDDKITKIHHFATWCKTPFAVILTANTALL